MFSFASLFKDKPKGLTLPEYKSLSNHSGEIQSLPLYSKYYVSLLQRDGNMAVPTVTIGQTVHGGDIIARPTSNIALHRHTPTSGEVTAIVDVSETHPSGMTIKAIEITADGKDTETDSFPVINNYLHVDREQLIERIFRAGIAGMGGAGFPTEKKINLNQPVETLIINGAECEPYITCDDILMRHYATEIVSGALIFARILRCQNILIGIEDNKPQAIQAIQQATRDLQTATDCHIGVHVLPTQYPMGSRHQIAHYLLGKRPNISKRSHQSGFICHNVATSKAVFDAVALGKPLIERLVTFSGDAVESAGVYRVKCGSNIADIVSDIGLHKSTQEIIIGGTMMGFAIPAHFEKPLLIKRETIAVLAFQNRPHNTLVQESSEENCIRCGQCADACPMDLLPQQLNFYGRGNDYEKLEQNRLFDCIECGLCNYVCPSNIPLVQVFQHSKGTILSERKSKQDAEHAQIRFETRNARIEAEKAEKMRKSEERRAKLKAQAQNNTSNPSENNDKQDLIAKALAKRKNTHDAPSATDKSNDKQDLIAQALARSQRKKANHTEASREIHQSQQDNKASDQDSLVAAAIARSQAKKKKAQEISKTTHNKTADAIAEQIAKRKADKAAFSKTDNTALAKEITVQSKNNTKTPEQPKENDKINNKEDLIVAAIARSQAKKKKAQETSKTTHNKTADAIAEQIAKRKADKAALSKTDNTALVEQTTVQSKNNNKTPEQPKENDKTNNKEDLIAAAIARSQAKKKKAQETNKTTQSKTADIVAEQIAKRKADKAKLSEKDKAALIAEALAKKAAKKTTQEALSKSTHDNAEKNKPSASKENK